MPAFLDSVNEFITQGSEGPDIIFQECKVNNMLTPGFGKQTIEVTEGDSVFRNNDGKDQSEMSVIPLILTTNNNVEY
jgi:hypothetical protein